MTEVPEHLLKRSRERREALGLSTPGAAPAPAESGAVEPAAAAAPEAAPAAPAAPAPAPAPAPPPPPKPDPPYIAAAKNRKRIPWWAMPVVASLPVWAGVYAWTLEAPSGGEASALALGNSLYQANCASCHGANGGGGVGPSFQDGAVVTTWENWRDHVAWVSLGDAGWPFDTYGNVENPVTQGMPGFGSSLSAEDIALIVRYEREELAGAEAEEDLVALTDAIAAGAAETAEGDSVEEILTEAQEPGDGAGGTREPEDG